MSKQNAELFARCLQQIEKGMPVEECLSQYPAQREELTSLFESIGLIKRNATRILPREAFRRSARARLLSRLPEQPVTFWSSFRHLWHNRLLITKRRFAMVWVLLITFAAAVFGGGGVVYASTDALPGDPLYGVKGLIEETQLTFANEEGDLALQYQFAEKRLGEMEALIAQNRLGDMPEAVEGYVNSVQAMAQIMAKGESTDPVRTQAEMGYLNGVRETQRVRLEQMLEQVPEQLQTKLQLAIQTTERLRVNRPEDAGQPEGAGQPEDAGQPENAGQPEENKQPEDAGKPDDAGNADGSGMPEDAGQPDNAGQPEDAGEGPHGPENQQQQGTQNSNGK